MYSSCHLPVSVQYKYFFWEWSRRASAACDIFILYSEPYNLNVSSFVQNKFFSNDDNFGCY